MQFDIFAPTPVPRVAERPRAVPPSVAPPIRRLLDAAEAALSTAVPFRTPSEAAAWATSVLGSAYIPDGDWTLDDAYDALEGAAHRVLRGACPEEAFAGRIEFLREREDEWFRGRSLTETTRDLAQFSTPLPIAEGAAYLAGAGGAARDLLEPCAGTGSLLRRFLSGTIPRVHANEIDPRRRHVLTWLGVTPSDRDALRLPLDRLRFDCVLSNPPFGMMKRGRAGQGALPFEATNIAQRYVAAHLRCLRPDGLLVALMPASTLSDAGAGFRRWIKDHHTPLLYLACPEGSYRSRGALRDAMLLVVRQGLSGECDREVVTQPSWETWTATIAGVAERLADRKPSRDEETKAAPAIAIASPPPTAPLDAPASGEADSFTPTDAGVSAGELASEPAFDPADDPAEEPEHERDACRAPLGAGEPVELAFPEPEAPPRAEPDWDREEREAEEARASQVFTPFHVSLAERRAPHPRLVVETRSMAGMDAPALLRRSFASVLADDAWGRSGSHGGASDEQAELAMRVLDAWDRGHGFLCADDVGVGKSREIALLVLESIAEGATRILVTTKNETNATDLEREFRRVASGHEAGHFPAQFIHVANHREAKGGHADLPEPRGAAVYIAHAYNFAEFSAALAAVRPTVWLADEAHEFANIAGSQRGLAWAELHERMLPYTSRIAYFTATPAVTLDQLSYLYGLRLWHVGAFDIWLARKTGKSTSEQDADGSAAAGAVRALVAEAVELGDTAGVDSDEAAADGKRKFMRRTNDAFTIRTTPAETEQVMRELKGSGHYLSRDLWRGGVSFAVEWIDLLADVNARARYDEAAQVCRAITLAARQFGVMNAKVKTAGLDRAMLQGYLKQLLFDLRLDAVLTRADAALDAGHQVVISVHSVAGDEEDCEALGSDAQEHAVNRRLESAISRINVREIKKETREGEATYIDLGEIPEALLAREELRERVRALPRLRNPVRVIEQHFGASNVAAITGRLPARLRTLRMGEFQAASRRVALISRAGKVGISLHDVSGHRRTMLVADYEWSADLFKQELGRVDRTGQRSAPEIVLMASTAAGERKFAATIAARMASLGATCKGSAESTGTEALDQFDMAGGIALEAMRNTVEKMSDTGRAFFTGSQFLERQQTTAGGWVWTPKRRPEDGTQMRHFLLEMLLFPIEEANRVLTLWEEERNRLLTADTLEALAARRTGRIRGEVIRERSLPTRPPLALVDVVNEEGEMRVIAQGFVTEHMVRIQAARGPDLSGNARTRRYLQFTATDGRLVSGLDLTPSEAHRIRWTFGQPERRDTSPEAILQDLRVGEKVDVQGANGAQWQLHLRGDRRIEIRGAKISRDRHALMRPSLAGVVGYEPLGGFLFLTAHEGLGRFLEHFPAAEEAGDVAAAA